MNKLDYLFMNAGIRFFEQKDASGLTQTIAVIRGSHQGLESTCFNKKVSQDYLNKKGLRTIDKLAAHFDTKIHEFKYSDLNTEPSHRAKRELSALRLGINMPSLRPVTECVNSLTPWLETRVKRGLPSDLLLKTISLLEVLATKTPREQISSKETQELSLVIAQLESWFKARKKKRLSLKPLRQTIKVLKDHHFILSKFIDTNLSPAVY